MTWLPPNPMTRANNRARYCHAEPILVNGEMVPGGPYWELQGGSFMTRVHDQSQCAGDFCTIHFNSRHHMEDWPQHWRSDRRLMERICPHGVGHPDPDDPNPDKSHGCDGCCR